MGIKAVCVLGAGGHAKVVISTLREAGYSVSALYDDDPNKVGKDMAGVPIVGNLASFPPGAGYRVVIGVGNNQIRRQIANRFLAAKWTTVVHPLAYVDGSCTLGPGTVVFAAAVVQYGACLGAHCIVNTAATVDHDCKLGDFVHVAPGCHLAGGVTLESGVLMGVGSVAVPCIGIGAWTTVGAGAAVINSLPPQSVCVGNPARVIRSST